MSILDHPVLFLSALFVTMVVVVELGFRASARARENDEAPSHEQIVNARDALRLLLSLLLGFTLAMALPRFDQRRQMMVEEANSIGATYLRAQFLPEPQRSRALALLREYVHVRRRSAELLTDSQEYGVLAVRSHELHAQAWNQAVEAGRSSPNVLLSLFASSLTDTISLADKRRSAVENRIPVSIWIMILLIALLASFATGYSAKRRIWLAFLATPIMVAIVMGLTADLDSARSGFIRTDVQSLKRMEQLINSPDTVPPATSAPAPEPSKP